LREFLVNIICILLFNIILKIYSWPWQYVSQSQKFDVKVKLLTHAYINNKTVGGLYNETSHQLLHLYNKKNLIIDNTFSINNHLTNNLCYYFILPSQLNCPTLWSYTTTSTAINHYNHWCWLSFYIIPINIFWWVTPVFLSSFFFRPMLFFTSCVRK